MRVTVCVAGQFHLDAVSSTEYKLMTSASLDRETVANYSLTLVCVDHGSPPLSGNTPVLCGVYSSLKYQYKYQYLDIEYQYQFYSLTLVCVDHGSPPLSGITLTSAANLHPASSGTEPIGRYWSSDVLNAYSGRSTDMPLTVV